MEGVFFDKVASLQPASILKRDSSAFLWSFQNTQLLLELFYKKAVLQKYNIHKIEVASDKCSVKKSINMLTSCGCFLHGNTFVGVSF